MAKDWRVRDSSISRPAYPTAISTLERQCPHDGPWTEASDEDDWSRASDLVQAYCDGRAQVRVGDRTAPDYRSFWTVHLCRPCSINGDYLKGLRCSVDGIYHANEWRKLKANRVKYFWSGHIDAEKKVFAWSLIDLETFFKDEDVAADRTDSSWWVRYGFSRFDGTPFVSIRTRDRQGQPLPWLVAEMSCSGVEWWRTSSTVVEPHVNVPQPLSQ